MTISTRDQLINALANNFSEFVINKASLPNSAAGQFFSQWTASGVPGVGGTPSSTPSVPTSATVGAFPFTQQTAPATSYLGWLAVASNLGASNFEIHDRLAHMGGLSGVITSAQTVSLDLTVQNPGAARRGRADYSEVLWWLEVYSVLGSTGVNATVNVTYDDGSTGNLSAIALGGTPRQGRLYPLVPAVAGRNIRGINSVTLSATTGTQGNFGFTATRSRAKIGVPVANFTEERDWARLNAAIIPNDSCLFVLGLCSSTNTPAFTGSAKIIHG